LEKAKYCGDVGTGLTVNWEDNGGEKGKLYFDGDGAFRIDQLSITETKESTMSGIRVLPVKAAETEDDMEQDSCESSVELAQSFGAYDPTYPWPDYQGTVPAEIAKKALFLSAVETHLVPPNNTRTWIIKVGYAKEFAFVEHMERIVAETNCCALGGELPYKERGLTIRPLLLGTTQSEMASEKGPEVIRQMVDGFAACGIIMGKM
jgi:hypothetical protein